MFHQAKLILCWTTGEIYSLFNLTGQHCKTADKSHSTKDANFHHNKDRHAKFIVSNLFGYTVNVQKH